MRILYFDCGMGAAGDMLAASLLELMPDNDMIINELNDAGIPGVVFKKESSVKCGIRGTHLSVTVNGREETVSDTKIKAVQTENPAEDRPKHVHGSSMSSIEHLVREHLRLPEKVKNDVLNVYHIIAEAESRVHGVEITDIHFHELGTMDAVADITAVCLLMYRIGADDVKASPVNVGSGQVRCAHGTVPVPAPATALILQDVPVYGGQFEGEMCTPTGAALIKYFVTDFGAIPPMKIKATGYGMGKKDFEAANCVRAMLGESEKDAIENNADKDEQDEICQLSCNVDDMTGEAAGYAMEQLLSMGALDVYTVPVFMKKNRPAILLRVICREADRETMVRGIFEHTSTIGIRENKMKRYVLSRSIYTRQTAYGQVRCKVASGYGIKRSKYEYEDIARIAGENGISFSEARSLVEEEIYKERIKEEQGDS